SCRSWPSIPRFVEASRETAERSPDWLADRPTCVTPAPEVRPREALDQARAPYFEALQHYASRSPGRYHVPGHKGGAGTDTELRAVLGEGTLALDIPMVTHGVDLGSSPTPLEQALELAADAWGARRTW